MFNDLYEYISLMFSWRWPKADGVITGVEIESIDGGDKLRLAVVYKFSLGDDGPYTGESFWASLVGSAGLVNINDKLRVGDPVTVRYRLNDPNVNKLDRSVWQAFQGL